jgi:hypothetical protein
MQQIIRCKYLCKIMVTNGIDFLFVVKQKWRLNSMQKIICFVTQGFEEIAGSLTKTLVTF